MTHLEAVQLLNENGYFSGYAITGETLILWLHDEDPPAPLTRPEASDVVAD
jgi:hypothetical protein